MKKFIKNWWPLLLIAGIILWKKFYKGKPKENVPNNILAYSMPSQDRIIADYISQLKKNGYTKSNQPCPICGGVLYEKTSVISPYAPLGAKVPESLLQIEPDFVVNEIACTNPECKNFDGRFAMAY